MLTSTSSTNINLRVPGATGALEDALRRSLAIDPACRFATIDELEFALLNALRDHAQVAPARRPLNSFPKAQ